jgi:hypothetical protein
VIAVILSSRRFTSGPHCLNGRSLIAFLHRAVRVHSTGFIIIVKESVLSLHLLDTAWIKERQLFCSLHVAHILQMTLGEDQINLFKRASLCFRIEDVDEGQKASVDDGEKEIGAPLDVVNCGRVSECPRAIRNSITYS